MDAATLDLVICKIHTRLHGLQTNSLGECILAEKLSREISILSRPGSIAIDWGDPETELGVV